MVAVTIAVFVMTPIVVHYFTFDLTNGSAASGFIVGIFSACVAVFKHPWGAAVLVFFLTTFVQFVFAYCVGEVFRFFGSDSRREFQQTVKSEPVPGRRLIMSGAGGMAIFITATTVALVNRVQTGAWPHIPPKAMAGFLAFFFVGLLFVVIGVEQRRRERNSARLR